MVDAVKQLYELYPYPIRTPADDASGMAPMLADDLLAIDHFVFGGRLAERRPLNILVAGGGTGDSLVSLVRQLRQRSLLGSVTYIDLSMAARRIAMSRAEALGLTGIVYLTGSLVDLPRLAPGPYDYIDCSGVLHHLPSPEHGLAALVRVLAHDGGLGIMLYGSGGRAGLYQVQDMLKAIAPPTLAMPDRIGIARRLLAALPESNPLKRNPVMPADRPLSDTELVDRYLHPCDRAYTVEQIETLVAGAGLRLAELLPSAIYDIS